MMAAFTVFISSSNSHSLTHTLPFYGRLGFCPGLPRWAGTRKVKRGR